MSMPGNYRHKRAFQDDDQLYCLMLKYVIGLTTMNAYMIETYPRSLIDLQLIQPSNLSLIHEDRMYESFGAHYLDRRLEIDTERPVLLESRVYHGYDPFR